MSQLLGFGQITDGVFNDFFLAIATNYTDLM